MRLCASHSNYFRICPCISNVQSPAFASIRHIHLLFDFIGDQNSRGERQGAKYRKERRQSAGNGSRNRLNHSWRCRRATHSTGTHMATYSFTKSRLNGRKRCFCLLTARAFFARTPAAPTQSMMLAGVWVDCAADILCPEFSSTSKYTSAVAFGTWSRWKRFRIVAVVDILLEWLRASVGECRSEAR